MANSNAKGLRCEGYTVYSSAGSAPNATLVDMNGSVIHQWKIGGQPVKVLPGGSLLGRKRNRQSPNNPLAPEPRVSDPGSSLEVQRRGGGMQDTVEFVQESWEGQEEWSFTNWDDDKTGVKMSRQHHDFQREGNPVGYYAPGQDFKKKGKTLILSHKNRNIPEISETDLLDDVFYEVDWQGNFTGFEWHGVDHFDEYGFDDSAKADLLRGKGYQQSRRSNDWLHINSMSLLGKNHWWEQMHDERFKPENIILSSRRTNMIAIISRDAGKLVWKVGPDFSAGKAEHKLGQFLGQHHAHMIPHGLPGAGNILVFDNGATVSEQLGYGIISRSPGMERTYSRIIEFNPVNLEMVWQYGAESGKEFFYSRNVSSAQRLPNGNTLITDGANGRLLEVSSKKEKVWEFIAPPMGAFKNDVYRSYRIPPEWIPGNPSGYPEWGKLYT